MEETPWEGWMCGIVMQNRQGNLLPRTSSCLSKGAARSCLRGSPVLGEERALKGHKHISWCQLWGETPRKHQNTADNVSAPLELLEALAPYSEMKESGEGHLLKATRFSESGPAGDVEGRLFISLGLAPSHCPRVRPGPLGRGRGVTRRGFQLQHRHRLQPRRKWRIHLPLQPLTGKLPVFSC